MITYNLSQSDPYQDKKKRNLVSFFTSIKGFYCRRNEGVQIFGFLGPWNRKPPTPDKLQINGFRVNLYLISICSWFSL